MSALTLLLVTAFGASISVQDSAAVYDESASKGWHTYVNVADGYELEHPADWHPHQQHARGHLYCFTTPEDAELDFSLYPVANQAGQTLEDIYNSMRPNLEHAEGARYPPKDVRRLTLGKNAVIEIPALGSPSYRFTLFLIDLNGTVFLAAAQVNIHEDTIRLLLASLREHNAQEPSN